MPTEDVLGLVEEIRFFCIYSDILFSATAEISWGYGFINVTSSVIILLLLEDKPGHKESNVSVFTEALARGSIFMWVPFKCTSSLEMSQRLHEPWRSSNTDLDVNFRSFLSLVLRVRVGYAGFLGAKTAQCFIFCLANAPIDFFFFFLGEKLI